MGAVAFCPGDRELVTLDHAWLRRWNLDGTQLASAPLVEDVPKLARELGLSGAWKKSEADPLRVRCRADGTVLAIVILTSENDLFRTAITIDRAGHVAHAPTRHYLEQAEFLADGGILLVSANDGVLIWRGGSVSAGPPAEDGDVGSQFVEGGASVVQIMHEPPARGDGLFVAAAGRRTRLPGGSSLGTAVSIAPDGSVAASVSDQSTAWGWVARDGRLGKPIELAPFGATQVSQVIASDHYFVTRDLAGAVHYATRVRLEWHTIDHPCGADDAFELADSELLAISHDETRLAVVCKHGGVRLIPIPD